MASSLDSLTNNLVKGGKKLFNVDSNSKRYNLQMRKGVYPYECMDSWDKLDETSLPQREKFYSKLTGSEILESDYEHAKKFGTSLI